MKTYHVVLAYEVKAENANAALTTIGSYPSKDLFNIQVEEQVEREPEDGNAS
jgi:hypothetical protein